MKSTKVDTVLIAYVATPHAGYLKFFRAYEGNVLYILGNKFIKEFPSLVRHLPGVTPEESKKMTEALGIFSEVHILTPIMLDTVRHLQIVMPDEDVSRAFRKKYLLVGTQVSFDDRWKLRWDWGATQVNRRPEFEHAISRDEFDRDFMRQAQDAAKKSPDWWRQIGAVLVGKDKTVRLVCFNQHVPSEQSAYCSGDPRSNFEPGESIEVSSALHAEAGIFAEVAKRGIRTQGCYLFVTTFPCPPCAYLCANTGIRRLYYLEGYVRLEGAEVFQKKGVEIIRVEV